MKNKFNFLSLFYNLFYNILLNDISIKIFSFDLYFLKNSYLKLNYFLNLFNLNYLSINKIKNKSIFSLNSSHISNIKSKEHFELNYIKIILKLKNYFYVNFIFLKVYKLLILRNVKFKFNVIERCFLKII